MWTRSGLWQPGVDALLGKPSMRAPSLPPPLPPPRPSSELLALGGVFILAVGGTFALGICGVALRERLLACLGAPRSRPLLAGVASSTATPRGEPPGRGVEVVATPYLD